MNNLFSVYSQHSQHQKLFCRCLFSQLLIKSSHPNFDQAAKWKTEWKYCLHNSHNNTLTDPTRVCCGKTTLYKKNKLNNGKHFWWRVISSTTHWDSIQKPRQASDDTVNSGLCAKEAERTNTASGVSLHLNFDLRRSTCRRDVPSWWFHPMLSSMSLPAKTANVPTRQTAMKTQSRMWSRTIATNFHSSAACQGMKWIGKGTKFASDLKHYVHLFICDYILISWTFDPMIGVQMYFFQSVFTVVEP